MKQVIHHFSCTMDSFSGWLWLGCKLFAAGYVLLMIIGIYIAAGATPRRQGQSIDEFVSDVLEVYRLGCTAAEREKRN